MKTIETARTLLADASPELRRAVADCITDANFTGYMWGSVALLNDSAETERVNRDDAEWEAFARKLSQ